MQFERHREGLFGVIVRESIFNTDFKDVSLHYGFLAQTLNIYSYFFPFVRVLPLIFLSFPVSENKYLLLYQIVIK